MHTLRYQILALITSLVLITSVVVLATFWFNTSRYTSDRVKREFDSATRTFEQLLQSQELQLINSAELLTSDFGFKQAVATGDEPTIDSVLFNHGARVEADLMFLTTLDGMLQAATHPALPADSPFPFDELIRSAARQGGAIALVPLGGELFQLVIIPVRAPLPIGFSGVGFKLDQDVAEELKTLTGLEVTFTGSELTEPVTTLTDSSIQTALDAPAAIPSGFGITINDDSRWVSHRVPLPGATDTTAVAVITRDLYPAHAEFALLRDEIVYITIGVMLLAAFGGWVFANNISEPINRLVGIAGRMARGDYSGEFDEAARSREVRSLFSAFRSMGRNIESRESQITWQATHDALTGLANRNHLTSTIDAHMRAAGFPVNVLSLNVRGFSQINDAFGQDVGDECLRQIASRLVLLSGSEELAARTGADEFLCVIPVGEDREATVDAVHEQLGAPMSVQDLSLSLQFASGSAISPEHGDTGELLVRRSGIALQKAREEHAHHRDFETGEDEAQSLRLSLIHDLRQAILADDGQLFMVYQPKLNLASGRIEKLESLIRWIHPELGFQSPETFIALAEQSDLILELTDWVILAVTRQCHAWHDRHPDLQVAINISSRDLERDDLLPLVERQLAEYELSPDCICFEMTERDMMQDADKAMRLMQGFRSRGFDLSIDDYGIGHSSLAKLKDMPVCEIKIDKHFVTHLDESTGDQTIVKSTIALGHSLGLRVIAEGVETAAAQQLLHEFGCDYVQGYHLSKPLPADDVSEWIRAFSPSSGIAL